MPDTTHAYDHVRGIYFPIAIGVFALVVGTLLVFVVLGARRRRADSEHSEAPRVELVYALVLAAVVAFLVVVTFRAESPIDRAVADPRLRIEVTAARTFPEQRPAHFPTRVPACQPRGARAEPGPAGGAV
jgi:heme/copper-type cytochrome/quinol oxidase subunit 2